MPAASSRGDRTIFRVLNGLFLLVLLSKLPMRPGGG